MRLRAAHYLRKPALLRTADVLRTAAWALIVALAFSVVGLAAGPRWHPDVLSTTLVPESSDVAVLGSTPSTVLGQYETVSRIIELPLTEEVSTRVLVVEPVNLTEPAPAVVFLHGAGTGAAEAFLEHAEAFASAGLVAISPSKRLDTYSTLTRDYVEMAHDYAKSVELARSLPEVDPERVGLYGESEGAWIATVLAAEDPDLSFLSLVSAPVVQPREQMAFAVDAYLRAVGVPRPLLRAIPRAMGVHLPGALLNYADFDSVPYLREVTEPIFMAYGTADLSMPIVQGPQIVMGSVPGGVDQVMVRYYADANHGIRIGSAKDPVVPDFLAGAAEFMLHPVEALEVGPQVAGASPTQVHLANAVPQVRWYADGEMVLRVPGISALVVAGGWLVLLSAWVLHALLVRRQRRSSGRLLASRKATALLVPAAGADEMVPDGVGQVGREASDGVGQVGGEASDGVGQRGPRFVLSAVMLSLATLLVVVVLVVYIASVGNLAVNYSTNGLVVWGGWILLQVLALVAALATVIALRSGLRALRAWYAVRVAAEEAGDPLPFWPRNAAQTESMLCALGAFATILGSLGLLFVAAYWGAFSPLT